MRWLIPILIPLLFLASGKAWAGIYCAADNLPPPFRIPGNQVQEVINDLVSCLDVANADPARKDSAPRKNLLKELEILEKLDREGRLSSRELVEMTGILLRLGRSTQVRELLEHKSISPDDPNRFLLLLHQAVSWRSVDLSRAINLQEQGLSAWPRVWVGATPDILTWYRRCEQLNLLLWRLRLREMESGNTNWKTVDAIFPGVRFVGPSGEYQAGEIETRSHDKLSPDALFQVLQLWLWYPEDDRLSWLLAEILNANGQVDGNIEIAEKLMKNLGNKGLNDRPDLRNHRHVLAAAVDVLRELRRPENRFRTTVFWAMLPPLNPLCGIGMGLNWTGPTAAILAESLPPASSSTSQEQSNPVYQLNWKEIFISFIAGSIFTAFLYLQIREWNRRRRARVSRKQETISAG